MWGHSGVVVSALDFRSEGRWLMVRCPVLAIELFPYIGYFTPHCLSPPRCLNGYCQHTARGNPAMD